MEQNQNADLLSRPPKRSDTLNVLTILTIIGCCLAYVGTFWGFYTTSPAQYEKRLAEAQENADKLSGTAANFAQEGVRMMEKNHEYRMVLLLAGIVFTTFCLIGALQMRKLKKSGYPLYVIGELAPLILSFALIGFSKVGLITSVISAAIALLFVILYSVQRKNLVY
jgi:hypothetical protein